jgi:hypothetical protein
MPNFIKISNPEKERPKQKEGTTAQKNPCQGFTSFSLAVRSKDAFNWFLSVVVCKAANQNAIRVSKHIYCGGSGGKD